MSGAELATKTDLSGASNGLKTEIDALRAELKSDMELLKREITIRTGGMFVIAVGVIMAAMRMMLP